MEKHSKINVVPSYDGWIRLKNALHLWRLDVFKAIGNYFRGFEDYANANSGLIECVEVAIKVNCVITAEIGLVDGKNAFAVQVVSSQDWNLMIDKVADVHGSFSSEENKGFHKGVAVITWWTLENSW